MNFARTNGFFVRRARTKGNVEHPLGVHRRDFVCHRAGQALLRKSEELRNRKIKKSDRTKCEAQMVIKKKVLSSGAIRWMVINFSDNHNHEMLDTNEIQNLISPSYRYISTSDRERILTLAKGGCNLGLIMRALEMEKGVEPGQLKFTEKDLKNFLQASKCVNRENEGSELLKFFKGMKEKNPDFRYDFTVDANNKLGHISWSYLSSILAYNVFGDVVVFDTMYRLHAYDRPVGVWFGINNHGQPIFFGCVLLLDEKPDSLRWALESFIRLMDGRTPQTMVTDINIGLKEAMFTALPTVKHAISVWHLSSKLASWFSDALGSQFDKFKAEFLKVYESDTEEEFEQQWNQLVTEYKVSSDRHISLLYEHRAYWVQVYVRGWFFGGLLTSGHPLSFKSFFTGLLNSSIKDFVEQVGVAVEFQIQAGEEAASQKNNQEIKIKTCMPLEEQAATVLTHYALEMFQKEIMASSRFAVYETTSACYLVRHYLKPDGGHIVSSIMGDGIHCSCKGFETSGIICRHVLRVLALQNCFSLHEKYVLTRWRRDSPLFPKSSGYKFRSQALLSLATIVVQESAVTCDRFDYAQLHLSKVLDHVREMPAPDEAVMEMEPCPLLIDPIADVVPTPTPSLPRGRPRKMKARIANEANETHAPSLDFTALELVPHTPRLE